MKKFTAQVDPDLRDLVPGFLEHKRDDARAIISEVSRANVDFKAISGIGHRLKGEGSSYGLDTISLYGAEIEQAAQSHDADAIRRYADELAAYIDSVVIEYE
jgi:HPt (histidine-containing phosphotransfer) domain-containing protein